MKNVTILLSLMSVALPVGAIICSLVFPELWKKRAYIAVVGVVLAANMAYYIARMATGAL